MKNKTIHFVRSGKDCASVCGKTTASKGFLSTTDHKQCNCKKCLKAITLKK